MPQIDTILIWFELSATWNKFKVFCSFAFDLVRHWCPLIDHFRSHSTYSHETQPSTIRIVFLSRSLYTFPRVVREEMLPRELPENLWISKRLQFQCDFSSIRFELQFVFLHSLFSRKSIPRLIDSHEIYLRTNSTSPQSPIERWKTILHNVWAHKREPTERDTQKCISIRIRSVAAQ